MKCRSVACIWSGTPPLHRVTATAVLNQPPTLYTGGSDGSILWWSLSSSSNSNPEIKPVAMLCGHAAPVADLGICYPVALSGDGKKQHSSNVAVNSISQNYGALLSVCTDGVLCVWSRGSGHCRRRRKLPPWVGSPSIVRTLPSNPRYVCIACCFQHADAVHLFDHHSVDHIEASEASINGESQHRKPPKCTLVIVDTYTLTIVQTIFHGHLSIGPLKFIAVVSCVENREKHSVLMADSFGRLQLVSISKDSLSNREGGDSLQKSHSHLDMAVWADGLGEGGSVVSIATHGNIVALVLKDRCIFRLLPSGATIGEVSITDNFLCPEGYSTPSHITGGMFLESNDAINILNTEEQHNISLESFVMWSNRGSAIIYRISYMDSVFKSQPLCEIPAASHRLHVRLSFCFIQLNHFLIRIESACFNNEERLKWKPHVTIWALPQKRDDHWKLWQESKILGESKFFVNRVASSTSFNEVEGPCGRQDKFTSSQTSIPSPENINYINADDECDGVVQKERIVSSSMVISENFYTPYAVVYGFYSGEIEVVLFNMLQVLHSHKNSPHHEVDSHASRRYFSGHAGAVLCLAAHRMVGTAKGWSFKQVLVSGSMDCTIRLWDLDTGNLITVMHHHVAPVRQIILPPPQTDRPWNDCFLSVGEDSCVSLSSLETLRVERMFPGHPNHPAKVVWDCVRGYIACLCRDHSGTFDDVDVLHIWDIKTGARERTLRGTASHSMFDHFCRGINMDSISGTILNGNTSVSSLLLPIIDDARSESHINNLQRKVTSLNKFSSITNISEPNTSKPHVSKENSAKQPKLFPIAPSLLQSSKHPIKCYCPFPGIATLNFDLGSLMFPCWKNEFVPTGSYKPENTNVNEHGTATPRAGHVTTDDGSNLLRISTAIEEHDWIRSIEECILRFSLSFLHLWDVDCELDELLITDMKLKKPENFFVASGLQGDKGSLTLTFPGLSSVLELWKSSSEFCAMRSLTMVSLAQRMISLSHSSSAASSALAAFYTRNFAEKIPDIKPPLLQLLVSFWQDESEHVRMAARSLFHCAASRAIPFPLCSPKTTDHANFISSIAGVGQNEHENSKTEGIFTNQLDSDRLPKIQGISLVEDSKILAWLESYEVQDWISCVGGTSQDAMTSHIIVAAALAIWYPSLVQPSLAALVIHPLMKLVMAMNEKYSSTAAELLAEGMERTWKTCIGSEIPHLIGDIFFQIECVSGASANSNAQHPAVPVTILETLVEILLPSLAMADILGFLTVIESLIWSTASDSPVHLVSLMTLIRVVRGSPRNLVQHLDKAVSFILQTIEPGNSVMRKICLQSSMTALKEVARVFPMVALNDTSSRLAVGDAIGEINSASIRVYDMQSVTKLKVLDASGPPGLPNLLAGVSEMALTTAISALSFSPDGEGLVAFSEHGLMIRWWSLGSVWWEKLSRNYVPVQCTKLIFVPPWEGFSSNSSRTSIMASITGNGRQVNSQDTPRGGSDMDSLKRLIHNLDLSYRLEWVSERKVLLTTHGYELGTFQL